MKSTKLIIMTVESSEDRENAHKGLTEVLKALETTDLSPTSCLKNGKYLILDLVQQLGPGGETKA